MADRYQALDHVELEAARDSPVAAGGETRRGHEFHYSSADVDADATFAFDVVRGRVSTATATACSSTGRSARTVTATPESGAFDAFADSL